MYEGRKRFHIKVGDSNVGVIQFDEVLGLETEDEWSEADSYYSNYLKELHQEADGYTKIIFRGGNIQGDRFLLDFFMGRGIDRLNPKTITLTLLDKRSNPVRRWVLEEAFPSGVQIVNQPTPDYNIFIESVSIVFKNVEIEVLE